MREIKFRGLTESKNKWIYGYYLVNSFGEHTIFSKDDCQKVKPETVGQYTGLKDKNGLIYIYEGDIIGVDGTVRGNRYENTSLLQDSTNLIIEGFGTKNWWTTYKEAVARGCKDAE